MTDAGQRDSFDGNVKETATGDTSGHEHYQDHGSVEPLKVKSVNVQAITCSPDGTQASIFGQATINGSGIHDSGDHVLGGGNIQIR